MRATKIFVLFAIFLCRSQATEEQEGGHDLGSAETSLEHESLGQEGLGDGLGHESLSQGESYQHGGGIDLGGSGHESFDDRGDFQPEVQHYHIPVKTVETSKPVYYSVLKKIEYPVPKPHQVSVPHVIKVPVPQPYAIPVKVPHPIPVHIYKLVPQEIEKKVPITVEKIVPNFIEKPFKVEVEKHYPVEVKKPYPVKIPVFKHVYHHVPKKGWE